MPGEGIFPVCFRRPACKCGAVFDSDGVARAIATNAWQRPCGSASKRPFAEQTTRPSVHSPACFLQKEDNMARALILWLMGVPLFVVVLLWYFYF